MTGFVVPVFSQASYTFSFQLEGGMSFYYINFKFEDNHVCKNHFNNIITISLIFLLVSNQFFRRLYWYLLCARLGCMG